LKDRAILKAIILQKTGYYKDSHLRIPSAQVFGGFVPRDAFEVGISNQQVGANAAVTSC
jgi:hypothetical protein